MPLADRGPLRQCCLLVAERGNEHLTAKWSLASRLVRRRNYSESKLAPAAQVIRSGHNLRRGAVDTTRRMTNIGVRKRGLAISASIKTVTYWSNLMPKDRSIDFNRRASLCPKIKGEITPGCEKEKEHHQRGPMKLKTFPQVND